jgi:hypothetical protein
MVTHAKRLRMTFKHPFSLKGVDRPLAPGDYEIVTDEELIQEPLSPVYRSVSTLIFLPAQSHRPSSIKQVNVDPAEVVAAYHRDQGMQSSRQVEATSAAMCHQRKNP